MRDTTLLGPWVRRFLLEHLIGERNPTANLIAASSPIAFFIPIT